MTATHSTDDWGKRLPDDYRVLEVQKWTTTPGGRFKKDGPFSGEEFRSMLNQSMESRAVLLDLEGLQGLPPGFVSEAFYGFKEPRRLYCRGPRFLSERVLRAVFIGKPVCLLGLDLDELHPLALHQAHDRLLSFGFDVTAPEVDPALALRPLAECEALAVLPGWENSVKVRRDVALARDLGLQLLDSFACPLMCAV